MLVYSAVNTYLAKKAAARSSAPDTPAAARQRIQAIRSQVEPVLARNRVGGAPPTRLAKRIREVDSLVKASSFFEVASYLVEADPPAQAEAEQLLVFHQDYAAAVEAASGILEGRFLSGLVRTKYLELLAQVRAEEGPVATLYETLRQRASGDGASSQVTAAAAADDPGPPPPVASKAPRRAPK